jgi:hypothetical protein
MHDIDEQIEAAACTAYRKTCGNVNVLAMRAALAAAQAGDGTRRLAVEGARLMGRDQGRIEGFAAGIEAAAKREDEEAIKHIVGAAWTDDRGITLYPKEYPGDGFKPANGPAIAVIACRKRAAAIRDLRPAAQAESTNDLIAKAVSEGATRFAAAAASEPAGAPSEEQILAIFKNKIRLVTKPGADETCDECGEPLVWMVKLGTLEDAVKELMALLQRSNK